MYGFGIMCQQLVKELKKKRRQAMGEEEVDLTLNLASECLRKDPAARPTGGCLKRLLEYGGRCSCAAGDGEQAQVLLDRRAHGRGTLHAVKEFTGPATAILGLARGRRAGGRRGEDSEVDARMKRAAMEGGARRRGG